MIKNVTRIIEKSIGKIDVRYDMCISDIEAIEKMSYSKYDFITNGFRFGYMQGLKADRAEMKRNGVINGL